MTYEASRDAFGDPVPEVPARRRLRDRVRAFFARPARDRRDRDSIARPVHPLLSATAPARLSGTVRMRSRPMICDYAGDGAVMVVTRDPVELSRHIHWLETMGIAVETRSELRNAVQILARRPQAYALAVIDIDAFGGICATYDILRSLRERLPGLALILLSAEVASDDFGTSRLAIADVTLRKPLSCTTLELGVIEAHQNNLVWQSRDRTGDAGAQPTLIAI